MSALDAAIMNTNILFTGSYVNPLTPLWASAMSGAAVGPNIQVSSLTVNGTGAVILDAEAPIFFDRASADASIIKMDTNYTGGGNSSENISIENITGTYYDNLALGNLIVYGDNIATGNVQGSIGILTQHAGTTSVELITSGFYTSSIICSSITAGSQNISTVNISSITADSGVIGGVTLGPNSDLIASTIQSQAITASTINGYPFNGGGGGVPPDILVSTITVNAVGALRFTAGGTSSALVTSGMFFDKSADIPQTFAQGLKMATNRTAGLLGNSIIENISITHVDDLRSPPGLYYDSLALGDLYVYGTNNPKQSTVGQVAKFRQFSTTTDLEIVTTGLRTSTISASTINLRNATIRTANISTLFVSSIEDYVVKVSTANIENIVSQTLSSATGSIPFFSASTLQFKPSLGGVDLGGIDLGLGGFLGGLTGELVSGAMTTTIAGAALGTGIAGLILPRTNNYISYPGSLSTFQTINAQTQLQVSTLGENTSTFSRFVSSIDGGTITPGFEYIVSSVIAPGTACIRSFSDPLNLANASTATSTVQSFGYWTALPTVSTVSTVTGNFNVTSTLEAYNAIFQSSMVGGNIVGANIYASSLSTTQTLTSSLRATGGNVSTLTVSSINGLSYPPTVTPSQQFSTLFVSSLLASTIQTGSISSTWGSISSLNISSINGQQFTPGGGAASNKFSTLFVSSLSASTIQTGSISSSSGSISTMNIGQFNSANANIGGVSISSGTVNGLDMIASSFIGNTGLFVNPPALGFTLINNNQIQTTGTLTAPIFIASSIVGNGLIFSPQATLTQVTVSSINGQQYPPQFSSTIIGNFNVTSTLTASSISQVGTITAANLSLSQNILASGNITGNTLIANNGINCIAGTLFAPSGTIGGVGLGPLGFMTATNAVIDGVTISPPGLIVASNVNLSQNLQVSSINGAQYPPANPFASTVQGNFNVTSTLTAYRVNVSTSVNCGVVNCSGINNTGSIVSAFGVSALSLTATNLVLTPALTVNTTAAIPAITGLATINGAAYPPPVTSPVSTFNQLFTSSFVASNVTTNGINTGYISSLQANIGGVSISSATVYAPDVMASSLLGNVVLLTSAPNPGFTYIDYTSLQVNNGRFSTIVSSNAVSTQALYVSSINNAPYPPPANALISTFSTITVSSLATSGSISTGAITAAGGVIGAVTLTGGQVNAALVTGTQVNANSMTVQTTVGGTSIVAVTGISYWSTMVVNGAIGAGADNVVNFQNGAICGTSNVGFELNVVSSCRVGGNLSTIGNLIVGGAINVNQISLSNAGVETNIGPGIIALDQVGSPGSVTLGTSNIQVVGNNISSIGLQVVGRTLIGTGIGNDLSVTIEATTAGLTARNPATNESVQVAYFTINMVGAGLSPPQTGLLPGSIRLQGSGGSPQVTILAVGQLEEANIETARIINPEVNNGVQYTTGNQNNTSILPSQSIAGYGTAAMTYTKIQSGNYSWGPLFNFTNGTNYVVQGLELNGAYPTFLLFSVQSRGNVGGNFTQIFGSWNIYVGFTDGVAGILQPTAQQYTIFSHNCSINFTVNSLNGNFLINVVSNVGGPQFVTDVRCSWVVQPLFPY